MKKISNKKLMSVLLGSLVATAMVGCNSGSTTKPNNLQQASQAESGNVGTLVENKFTLKFFNDTSEDITISVPDSDHYDCLVSTSIDGLSKVNNYNCGAHDGAGDGHPEQDLNGYRIPKGQTLYVRMWLNSWGLGDLDGTIAIDFNNRAGVAISSSVRPYDGKYSGALKTIVYQGDLAHHIRLLLADATKYNITAPTTGTSDKDKDWNLITIKDKPITAIGEISPGTKLEPGSRFVSKNGKYELDVGTYGFNIYGGNGPNNNTYTQMANEDIFDDHFKDEHSFVGFQGDSNIVAYSQVDGLKPFWSTGTVGKAVEKLVMGDNGNLVAYHGSQKVWDSGTGKGDDNKPSPVFFRDSTSLPHNYMGDQDTLLTPGLGRNTGPNRLVSDNGLYELVLQEQGNLVLYDSNMNPTWVVASDGPMQTALAGWFLRNKDGNLNLYDQNGALMWSDNTNGFADNVTLTNEGALVAHGPLGNTILWQSTDRRSQMCSVAQPNCPSFLRPRQPIVSPNGKFTLELGTDGNLVEKLTDTNQTVWSTNTGDSSLIGSRIEFVLQKDGNSVIYAWKDPKAYKVLWANNEPGVSIDKLKLNDNGSLVAYSSANLPMWDNGVKYK